MRHLSESKFPIVNSPTPAAPKNFLSRCIEALDGPQLYVFAGLLALVICFPVYFAGPQLDDHQHQQVLAGTYEYGSMSSWYTEFFTFADGKPASNLRKADDGISPWWTHPEFKCIFSRPLGALTHRWDDVLWRGNFPLMHLHTVLWYIAVIVTAGMFYRRIFPTGWGVVCAVLLFTIDDMHGVVVTWIASRNAMVSATLGMLCLLAHVRWRKEGGMVWAVLSPMLLLLALLAGESAVAIGAFVLAYALTLDTGSWRNRLLSVLPCALAGVGWFLVYRALKYGTAHSGLYSDPGSDLVGFLKSAWSRLPLFLGAPLGLLGSELWLFSSEQAQSVIELYCWIVLAILFWTVWPLLRRDAVLRFWGTSFVLAVLPTCTAFAMDRVLFLVSIASAAFVARWFELVLHPVEQGTTVAPPPIPMRTRISLAVFGFIAIGVSLPLFPWRIMSWNLHEYSMISTACSKPFESPKLPDQDVIILQLPDAMYAWHLKSIRREHGLALPRTSRILTTGVGPARLTRPDANTLVVGTPNGTIEHPMSKMWCALPAPFRPGDKIELSRMTVTILKLSPSGDILEFACKFPVPLEDPSLIWTRWEADQLVPLELPAIGETVELSATKLWADYSSRTLLDVLGVPPINRATVTRSGKKD
jgi:hypothetical protein